MRVSIPIDFDVAPASPVDISIRRSLGRLTVQQPVAPLIRWLFYAFMFSLPFETVNFGPVEPPAILGGLLLLSTVFQPGLFLRWPSRGFWCFIVYLYLSITLGVLELPQHPAETPYKLFLLIQLVILCWLSYNLMLDEQLAKTALSMLVVACALLAFLQITGMASRAVDVGARVERVTAFGFNPNNLARILTLGLLACIGLTYGRRESLVKPLFLMWPVIGLIGIALVQTGSRGALLALGAGLTVFVLRRGSVWSKLRNMLGILIILSFFIWVGFQSDITRQRFERTFEDGDLARREQIYPNAWQMFQEKPLIGWGPVTSTYELGSRLGHIEEDSKNPHNLILYALVSTGLLGAIPLFTGMALAAWAAWKARSGPRGVLPLAMIVAVMAANLSNLWLFNKLHWIVMAYALASGTQYASVGVRLFSRVRAGAQRRGPISLRKQARGELVRARAV
jgi:O-antigen ligase